MDVTVQFSQQKRKCLLTLTTNIVHQVDNGSKPKSTRRPKTGVINLIASKWSIPDYFKKTSMQSRIIIELPVFAHGDFGGGASSVVCPFLLAPASVLLSKGGVPGNIVHAVTVS